MLIRNESLAKLKPGHIIRVRYDPLARDRVFVISPIKAWDEWKREFS